MSKLLAVHPLSPRERGRGEGHHQKMSLPSGLLNFARRLRKEATSAEQFFWLLLRNRRFMGLKFRRQHSLPPFVIDFYCEEIRLAVELDGGQHNQEPHQVRDEKRTARIHEQGIEIVRYWNNDVMQNTEGVLEDLMTQCQLRVSPSPAAARHPLPVGEGL